MDNEDIQCVGICMVDPDTGYCLGCGRRAIDFSPEPAPTQSVVVVCRDVDGGNRPQEGDDES